MIKSVTFCLIILFLFSCNQQSKLDLTKDYLSFEEKMEENDSIKLFVNSSWFEYPEIDEILITKEKDSIKYMFVSKFYNYCRLDSIDIYGKEIKPINPKIPAIKLAINDTLKFSRFFKKFKLTEHSKPNKVENSEIQIKTCSDPFITLIDMKKKDIVSLNFKTDINRYERMKSYCDFMLKINPYYSHRFIEFNKNLPPLPNSLKPAESIPEIE